MTKQTAATATKDVVIPGTVAIGLMGIILQSMGFIPKNTVVAKDTDAELRAAFVAWDKNYREDQKRMAERFDKFTDLVSDLRSDISQLKGKLEK